MIEHVRTQSGKKKIYLVTAGPASLLVLRGALEWQWKHPGNPALAGGILLYPELYAVTPAPGVEAHYDPESCATRCRCSSTRASARRDAGGWNISRWN